MVVGWLTGNFLVYDVVSTAIIASYDAPGTNNGHALAFSPHSTVIAAGGGSGVYPVLHYARPMELAHERFAAAKEQHTRGTGWVERIHRGSSIPSLDNFSHGSCSVIKDSHRW